MCGVRSRPSRMARRSCCRRRRPRASAGGFGLAVAFAASYRTGKHSSPPRSPPEPAVASRETRHSRRPRTIADCSEPRSSVASRKRVARAQRGTEAGELNRPPLALDAVDVAGGYPRRAHVPTSTPPRIPPTGLKSADTWDRFGTDFAPVRDSATREAAHCRHSPMGRTRRCANRLSAEALSLE